MQEGGAKWREGVPASDGAFDYAPRDEGTVLSVGVACKSWAMFGGKVVPQGRYKYSGGVLANDGLYNVYFRALRHAKIEEFESCSTCPLGGLRVRATMPEILESGMFNCKLALKVEGCMIMVGAIT